MAAVSLRGVAIPSGSRLGLEPIRIVRSRWCGTVEARNRSVDALGRRSGWNRAITSAGRERQDAAEPVGRTFCGDPARCHEYVDPGKHRSMESGEESRAHCYAKPIGGGDCPCPRRTNDGIERDGECANHDWRRKLCNRVRSDGTAIRERGKSTRDKAGHGGGSSVAGTKPLRERDQPDSRGIESRKWP